MQKVEEACAELTADVIQKSCRNIKKRAQLCLMPAATNDRKGTKPGPGGHFQQLLEQRKS